MGMHDGDGDTPGGGLDFNSLLFMQLLWATFLSGGFHPVFVEKWHDRNAAADVVWVNQTWWLEGVRCRRVDPNALPVARRAALGRATWGDAADLARQHAAGVDPYRAPQAARDAAKQQKATGGGAGSGDTDSSPAGTGGGVLASSTLLCARCGRRRRRRCSRSTRRRARSAPTSTRFGR